MMYVLAVVTMCLVPQGTQGTQCNQQTIQIERAACHLRAYRARVPMDGEWHNAIIRIRCKE